MATNGFSVSIYMVYLTWEAFFFFFFKIVLVSKKRQSSTYPMKQIKLISFQSMAKKEKWFENKLVYSCHHTFPVDWLHWELQTFIK